VGAGTTLTGAASAIASTPATGDNSVNIATTAFVQSAVGGLGTMASQNANAVAITGGTMSGVTINSLTIGTNATGAKTISTSAPTGGSDGDIWYQVL
jgi:hypothetical protein